MAGFIYYVPTASTAKKVLQTDDLKLIGLEYAAHARGVLCQATRLGPDGGEGVVVTFNADGVDPRYFPDLQTWRKGPDGKFWVGMSNDARPGPADLQRGHTIGREQVDLFPGAAVMLLDGNEWTVPRCIGSLMGRPSSLPRLIGLGEDGTALILQPHPKYLHVTEPCDVLFREWASGSPVTMTMEDHFSLALSALSINYRIGRTEAAGLLGLFGTEEVRGVLRAMIDADEVERRATELADKHAAAAAGREAA